MRRADQEEPFCTGGKALLVCLRKGSEDGDECLAVISRAHAYRLGHGKYSMRGEKGSQMGG